MGLVQQRQRQRQAVRFVLDDAGLSWATNHSFCRTVAPVLHRGGVPLTHIPSTPGHRDVVRTLRYYIDRDHSGDKFALAAVL